MRPTVLAFALTAGLTSSGSAAASYTQNFDNVAALQSPGWIFRDQSSAAGQWWWGLAS